MKGSSGQGGKESTVGDERRVYCLEVRLRGGGGGARRGARHSSLGDGQLYLFTWGAVRLNASPHILDRNIDRSNMFYSTVYFSTGTQD